MYCCEEGICILGCLLQATVVKGYHVFLLLVALEGTARYAGLLLAPAEAFFALRAKKELIMLFWPIFGNFWCPVVTLVNFSSNISNFERNTKKTKKIQKKKKYI